MAIKFICEDCKRSRHTASGQIICTTIGVPEMAFRYGKCRRFEAKRKTFEDTTAREYCEGCLFFAAGTAANEPDFCAENVTAEDVTIDGRDIVTRCRLFKPNI